MRRIGSMLLLALIVVVVAAVGLGMVARHPRGNWPDTWPRELEPLREQATTWEVAHGIQEDVIEIPFKDRATFEKAWPHILSVKSPGAPLIVERGPSRCDTSGSTLDVGVRVLWPEVFPAMDGPAPEYVMRDGDRYVPSVPSRKGFRYRARADIVLVVDGDIVDLNRIALPPDTPIVDRRFGREPAAPDAHLPPGLLPGQALGPSPETGAPTP